ncbi:TetR/AcrR family transcriptional regulator [Xylophilus sp. Kf1]|nr:TetR/AcrR family transcriptional regulator [Xylophilus sp. Kf1]
MRDQEKPTETSAGRSESAAGPKAARRGQDAKDGKDGKTGLTGVARAERAYHHGDLRAALLAAAEHEVVENGVVGFSLRAAARRAHVSHAAPAHHFASAAGLLAALKDAGFARMAAAIARRMAAADATPTARLAAAGKAYVAFAREHPQLFRLMFTCQPGEAAHAPDAPPDASGHAFGQLETCIVDVLGPDADARQVATGVAAAWGLVHGLACLITDGVATFMQPGGPQDGQGIVDGTIDGLAATLREGVRGRRPG